MAQAGLFAVKNDSKRVGDFVRFDITLTEPF